MSDTWYDSTQKPNSVIVPFGHYIVKYIGLHALILKSTTSDNRNSKNVISIMPGNGNYRKFMVYGTDMENITIEGID